jgi:hypothetical protein
VKCMNYTFNYRYHNLDMANYFCKGVVHEDLKFAVSCLSL